MFRNYIITCWIGNKGRNHEFNKNKPMLLRIFFVYAMVAITVCIHAFGIVTLLHAMMKSDQWEKKYRYWSFSLLLIGLTLWLLFIHVFEIAVWGLFYYWQDCFPDVWSAYYFSGVTYTTVGFGDLLLPVQWRMLAPAEALTGILMCGLSTGLFFAIVSRLISNWVKETKSTKHSA